MLYIQLPQANDCSRYQTSNNADEDSARILPHSSFHADIGWSNILVRISPLFRSDWSRGTYMYTGCDLETNCLLPCIDITTYWQYSRPTTHGACAPQGRFGPYPCTISQHSSVSTKRSNSVLDTYRSGTWSPSTEIPALDHHIVVDCETGFSAPNVLDAVSLHSMQENKIWSKLDGQLNFWESPSQWHAARLS